MRARRSSPGAATEASSELDDRARTVLQAIIHQHIATAQPVGSHTITRQYRLGVRAASVRKVMSELERKGYLDHPHTSAGRVPTAQGYRLYVDSLMEVQRLSEDDRRRIEREYADRRSELEATLKATSHLLAQVSRAAGVVLMPTENRTAFRHVELIRLEPRRILAVVVGQSGEVQNRSFETDEELGDEELFRISRVLNGKLAGRDLSSLRAAVARAAHDDPELHEALQRVRNLTKIPFGEHVGEPLMVEGTANVLEQPEFADVSKVHALFRMLEERRQLSRVMEDAVNDGEAVHVRIGRENRVPAIRECSLVTKTYRIGDRAAGVIGILGPMRMDYDKMVSLVDYTAGVVNRVLTEAGVGGRPK